jgi:MoaA/NifB/PqqE/SkfB family radical SAM enzyme
MTPVEPDDQTTVAFSPALTGKAPILLRWDLTLRCNLACLHCCVGDQAGDQPLSELSGDQLKQALKKMAATGVAWVHLLGGEPTLRQDFLEIVSHARQLGLEVSYNTNGIRQSPAFLEAVLDLDPISVTVSIDGPDPASHDLVRGQGTFQKAIGLTEKLVAARDRRAVGRPAVQVQAVLMRPWISRAGAIVDLAAQLGADSVVINNLTAMGHAVPHWERLWAPPVEQFLALEQVLYGMQRHPGLRVIAPIRLLMMQYWRELTGDESLPLGLKDCDAISQMCHVNCDGTLVPCQFAHDRRVGGELAPPNVLDDDLEAAWASPYFRRFATLIKGDLETVYSDQLPCNRCIFLGRGCRPCPLPVLPGQPIVNPLCLIAEGLLHWGRERGGLGDSAPEERLTVMRAIVGSPAPAKGR